MDEVKSALAEVLRYTDKNPDETAEILIGKFESFYRIAESDFDAIAELSSRNDAVLIKVISALAARNVTDSFKYGREHTKKEIEELLAALFFDDSEEIVCFFPLDERDRLLSCERIGGGTISSSEFSLRRIIGALVKKNARRVIIAHNHPAGSPEPSVQDIDTTRKIRDIMRELDKELVCHYVVAGNRIFCINPEELGESE